MPAEGVTLDQPSASLAREASGGPTQMTLHTPSGWEWEKEGAKSRAPTSAERPSARQLAGEARPRARLIVAGAAAFAVVFVALGATMLSSKRFSRDAHVAVPTPTMPASSAALPVVAPPAPVPVAVPPAADVPAVPVPVADKRPAVDAPAAEAQQPARKSQHRRHARERAAAEWLTDPAGNPIAPP